MMTVDVWKYLVGNPGWWTLIVFGLYVVWSKRDALLGLFARRVEVAEKREQTQGTERWALIEQLISTHERQLGDMQRLYERAMDARQLADERLIDCAGSQQQAAMQSIEIMKEFADIARLMVTRQDEHDERMMAVLEGNNEIQNAVGFVLAKLYFGQTGNRTFRDLVAEMETNGNGDAVRGQ